MDMCLANGLRFVCVCFCFSFTIFVSSSSCVYRYVWKKGSIKTLYINERLLVGRSTTVWDLFLNVFWKLAIKMIIIIIIILNFTDVLEKQ